ncbi:MAG TPA: 1,4-dihydroxy-2-naphthoate polyprenyltransferase [Candidatus Dormibacteraeota bacterium]
MTPARVWWLAARPATLAASVSPVLVGTSVAVQQGGARWLPSLAALVVALAMQVGVNYANDYSDFQRGADTPRRRGPVRAAASGLVRPAAVRTAALAAFGVAAAVGLVLSLAVDWRLLIVGVLAVAAGWLYTGGPRPYGYLGLGEVFVFVFFGLFATCGTVYVESLRVGPTAWAGGVATGCLACAILVLNNLRDVETDLVAGKRTLAVRLGPERTRVLLAALLAVAFAAGLAARGLPLLASPLALYVWRLSGSYEAPVLVGALKRCAELEVWFALLWTLGVLA